MKKTRFWDEKAKKKFLIGIIIAGSVCIFFQVKENITNSRVQKRIKYWESRIDSELPKGSSKEKVVQWLRHLHTVSKSSFVGINSIKGTILDPNNKNGIWEDVSSTEVILKQNTNLETDAVRKIAGADFDKIEGIILEQGTYLVGWKGNYFENSVDQVSIFGIDVPSLCVFYTIVVNIYMGNDGKYYKRRISGVCNSF